MAESELAVIVRYTAYSQVRIEDCITLLRSYVMAEEAIREAARLNDVRRDDQVRYFVKYVAVDQE